MLLREERLELILKELNKNKKVYVNELSKNFNLSSETIRKDLNQLDSMGLLVKTHGGAIAKQNAIELTYDIREKENIEFKMSLAKYAANMIPPESSIIIGSGSTMVELSKLLTSMSGLKIFTSSIPVATILMNSDNQVSIFGGLIRNKSSSVSGGWAINNLQQINADISFIGSDGFSNTKGPSSPSFSDTFIGQTILKQSEKRVVLADYTKFHRKSLHKLCDWNKIDYLITNKNVDKKLIDYIDTEIILV